MHVAQLLHPLMLGPHVEIIEACLPNVQRLGGLRRTPGMAPLPARPRHNPLRVELLNQLHHFGWISHLRFTDQEMDVIGHDYVADYDETAALA